MSNKNIIILTLFFLFIVISFFNLPHHSFAKELVNLAIVPYYSPEKLYALYQPMIDYLNRYSKYAWRLKLYSTHEDVIKALCSKEVVVAMGGPIVLAKSHKLCGATAVLLPIGIEKGTGVKVLIVASDTKIKSLHDLVNKEVGIFKPITIVHSITKKMFVDEGIDIKKIRFVEYSKIDEIVEDVLTGKIAAGGIREAVYKKYSGLNLRVLKSSGNIPGFAFATSPNTDDQVIKDFQTVMLKLNIHKNKNTIKITRGWDEEFHNGFVLPESDYTQKALRLYELVKDFIK